MRTTNVRGDHDDDVVDLVTRTLGAVAEATPVADELSAAHDHVVAHSHRGRVRRGRGRTPHRGRVRRDRGRARVVVATAAAAAVAVVAFVTVGGGEDEGVDAPPTGPQDSTTPRPAIRMEAGWLPTGFDEAPSAVERSPGLDVPVEAALWGAGDSTVVAAAIDLGDRDGDPNILRRRTEAVRRALAGMFDPPNRGDYSSVNRDTGERGGLAFARLGASADVGAIASRIADGVAPAEAWPDGDEPTELPLEWVPGVGASVRVIHHVADPAKTVAVTVVEGQLPDAFTAQFRLPGAWPVEVRGRQATRFVPGPDERSWLIWQEEPGVVVIVAGDLSDGEQIRVAEGLVPVDEPAGDAEATSEVLDEGTIAGATYRIERTSGARSEGGACAAVLIDGDAAGLECRQLAGDPTPYVDGLRPVAEVDGGTLWWGSVEPGTATVSVDGVDSSGGVTAAVVPSDGDSPPVALVLVPADVDSSTFRFHAVDGELLGSSSFSGAIPMW